MLGLGLGLGLTRGRGAASLYLGLSGPFDYYIDATSGSDANGGTSSGDAWKSLSKIGDIPLSGGQTKRVLIASGTYATANDYVIRDDSTTGGTVGASARLDIAFEPGCVMDGTLASATSKNGFEFSGANSWAVYVYANGMTVQNYVDATAASPNGFGNRSGSTAYVYDMNIDNCEDGFSAHGTASLYTYDCSAQNCVKGSYLHVDTAYVEHHRCEFEVTSGGTTGYGGGTPTIKLVDCVLTPSASGAIVQVDGTTLDNCVIGGLASRIQISALSATATINDSFLNAYVDGNSLVNLSRCFGLATIRVRTGGSQTVEHCVFSGPASGKTAIILSDFNSGGGQTLVFNDNIVETSTAAAFMTIDATNAGYLVSAAAQFFNNVLSGSAAFDADLVSADVGGTVIVDNITADALIGSANTTDPDDYGYGSGSPAIGAATDGGNSGFAVGDVSALTPKRALP